MNATLRHLTPPAGVVTRPAGRPFNRRRRVRAWVCRAAALAACLATAAPPAAVFAQDARPPATLPAGAAPNATAEEAPILPRLQREIAAAYLNVRPSIVCIQLPASLLPETSSANPRTEPAAAAEPRDGPGPVATPASPSTPSGPTLARATPPRVQAVIMAAQLADERPQPAQPARQPMVNTPPGGLGTAVQNAQSRTAPGQSTSSSQTNPPNAPSPSSPQAAALAPLPRSYPLVVPSHAMGLKIDSDGHVLLPFFLDAKQLPTDELRAWTLDGKGGRAKFVGADAATRVTLLKLADDTNIGQPCRPSDLGRPLDAEVVLLLPDSVSGGQLILWTGGARDDGLVFNPDGTVRGFASDGRFVALTTADPVVRQLAATGKVKRPKIGVLLSEFAVGTASRPDDAPANRTALLVTEVIPGGPAEKAGVRKGDFVMTFNGIDIPDLPTFATAIAGADRPTKLKVLRDRRLVEVTLPLAP